MGTKCEMFPIYFMKGVFTATFCLSRLWKPVQSIIKNLGNSVGYVKN